MYKSRDITNFKTATKALDLLKSKNDFNKFQQVFTNIIKLTTNKIKQTNINKN
jgi:Zn-dependent M32 family carboxypeptidase